MSQPLSMREEATILCSRSCCYMPKACNKGADYRSFLAAAREWAQFGLLTTEQHRSQYRDLALLMRQGMPAEDAVKEAFGISLEELSKDFADRSWRYHVQFHLAPISAGKRLPAPTKLEPTEVERLLQVLASRARRDVADQM
jgi:hypothetical protein